MHLYEAIRTTSHHSCLAFGLPLTTSAALQTDSRTSASQSRPIVFVAGAAGNVGRRLVRKLAEAGCPVRAGSRDPSKCKRKVGQLAGEEQLVDFIQFDVTDYQTISSAIGHATVVVSTLGAPFSWGKVDGFGIANLMKVAARSDAVTQLVLVSSIGVGKPWAFPVALLNLFGAVLLFKNYSEEVTRRIARETRKNLLIVRPGGMERPTDDFSRTHNLLLKPRNSLAGGLVSSMQIAELITAAVLNPDAANGKTVEAIAEIDAPRVDMRTLLEEAAAD